MEFFKHKHQRKKKTLESKSKMEDREQFSIKKLKKKRRRKHITKNQKLHVIAKHFEDIEIDDIPIENRA